MDYCCHFRWVWQGFGLNTSSRVGVGAGRMRIIPRLPSIRGSFVLGRSVLLQWCTSLTTHPVPPSTFVFARDINIAGQGAMGDVQKVMKYKLLMGAREWSPHCKLTHGFRRTGPITGTFSKTEIASSRELWMWYEYTSTVTVHIIKYVNWGPFLLLMHLKYQ